MPKIAVPKETIKTNNLVKYNNETISLYRQATKAQSKFIAYLIAQVRMDDAEFGVIKTGFRQACAIAGVELQETEKGVDEFCRNMFKVIVKIKNGDETTYFPFLYKFKERKGILTAQIHPDMKPYLLELKKGESTSYRLDIIRAMKSEHSIRLYEYLKNGFVQTGTRNDYFELEPVEFRSMFLGKKEYRSKNYIRDIETRVIKPAIDEINAYSDLKVLYHRLKRGRSVFYGFTVEKNDTPWWVRAEKEAIKKAPPRTDHVAALRADPRGYIIEQLKKKTSMAKEMFDGLTVEVSDQKIIIQGEDVFLKRLQTLHSDDITFIALPLSVEYQETQGLL